MKFVVYLRVSTDQQVNSGLGLEAQHDICKKYISQNGNHPHILFIDDGYSGALSMDKRPNLLLAVTALEKGDVFIVARRDRLGRDVIVNAMIESAIERKKATLVSASGDFKNDSDPSSILMRRMVDAFSEYERLIIGVRTKSAMCVKKGRNERVGRIPFGFRLSNDKIHLEYDEREQTVLKSMIRLRSNGYTLREVAAQLNLNNLLNRGNAQWNHVAIIRILARPNDQLVSKDHIIE